MNCFLWFSEPAVEKQPEPSIEEEESEEEEEEDEEEDDDDDDSEDESSSEEESSEDENLTPVERGRDKVMVGFLKTIFTCIFILIKH